MRALVLWYVVWGAAAFGGAPRRKRRRLPCAGGATNHQSATSVITGSTLAAGIAQVQFPHLTAWGAKHAPSILAGQYWRLVTPMFLHASPAHIFTNIISLQSVGPQLERWYGRRRFVVTYVTSAITANVLSCTLNFAGTSVGASGAIAGIVGALAVHNIRHSHILRSSKAHLEAIGQVILFNVALGLFERSIDNAAHLGGFLGGAAAAFLIGSNFVPVKDRLGRLRGYVDKPLIPLGSNDNPTFLPARYY
ncbi:hypothetical protein CTAYLR_003063 [Chrysophaeum taylorii]|uniref:Peptidase S54 rhomboid domain-containing protein n=1 Tax=Chrysophaeum taylorii TaxID=2483200 RepID=A0AAD7U5J4_9STRA|nr:hypothetical protein CTAYLR_003063 [Chrysophaeum taylorii]